MPLAQLVDGGVTDNLGVRDSMMSPVAHRGNVGDMAGAFSAAQLAGVRHVLAIVANAQVYGNMTGPAAAPSPASSMPCRRHSTRHSASSIPRRQRCQSKAA